MRAQSADPRNGSVVEVVHVDMSPGAEAGRKQGGHSVADKEHTRVQEVEDHREVVGAVAEACQMVEADLEARSCLCPGCSHSGMAAWDHNVSCVVLEVKTLVGVARKGLSTNDARALK